MADELHFVGTPSQTGLTVNARVYDNAGAQVGGDIACAETATNAIYVGDMPTAGAGRYMVRFTDASETFLAAGAIDWDGTQEVFNTTLQTQVGNLNNLSAADVNSEVDTALADYDSPTKAELDAAEANIIASAGGDATAAQQTAILSAISGLNDISATDVTSAVPTVAQIEAALLDDGDGQALLSAIATAIGNQNVDEIALVAAIRADLERTGGSLDNLPTLAEMEGSAALTAVATGTMDANIVSVNGVTVDGTGAEGDEWGPA